MVPPKVAEQDVSVYFHFGGKRLPKMPLHAPFCALTLIVEKIILPEKTYIVWNIICEKILVYIELLGVWNVLLSIFALAARGSSKYRLMLLFAL